MIFFWSIYNIHIAMGHLKNIVQGRNHKNENENRQQKCKDEKNKKMENKQQQQPLLSQCVRPFALSPFFVVVLLLLVCDWVMHKCSRAFLFYRKSLVVEFAFNLFQC